jgi:hypothetical protein
VAPAIQGGVCRDLPPCLAASPRLERVAGHAVAPHSHTASLEAARRPTSGPRGALMRGIASARGAMFPFGRAVTAAATHRRADRTDLPAGAMLSLGAVVAAAAAFPNASGGAKRTYQGRVVHGCGLLERRVPVNRRRPHAANVVPGGDNQDRRDRAKNAQPDRTLLFHDWIVGRSKKPRQTIRCLH